MEPTGNAAVSNSCNFNTRFEARHDAVPSALAFLAQALLRGGLARDLVERSEMILEELFRNVILHGYRGDTRGTVWIAVSAASFRFEDEAPAFDPLNAPCAHLARDMGGPTDILQAGGVGLLLIRRLARQIAYSRVDGRNRVEVTW